MERKSLPSLLRLLNAWLPPVLWASGIFYLSSQGVLPSFTEVWHDFIFKKTAHMFVYGVLYLLFYRAFFISAPPRYASKAWVAGLALTLVYAASDEIHQMYVTGRYGTIRDVGYDMLGAGVVLLRQYQYI